MITSGQGKIDTVIIYSKLFLCRNMEGLINQQIEGRRYRLPSEVVRTSLRLLERKFAVLRQSLIEGENSGEAEELDMKKIKARARQRVFESV